MRTKYGNIRSKVINGRSFHSLREAEDALWLQGLEKQGFISDLKYQQRYEIFVNGYHIVDSIVDFQFKRNGKLVWYETKGMETDKFIVVKRLIKATVPEGEVYLVNGTEKEIRDV